ncbi:MAG: NAD kinase, partial [Bartonella sp.]|nr:NAD kinase [Bartonella sp.]
MTTLPSRFHFISAETEEAIKATNKLISIYGHSSLEDADV